MDMDMDILTIIKYLIQTRNVRFAVAIFIMFMLIAVITKSCQMGAHEVKKFITICIISGLICEIFISAKIKNMPPQIQTQILQEFQQKLPFGRLL